MFSCVKVRLSPSKNLFFYLFKWWKKLFFMLKALFLLDIFPFLSWRFGYVEKQLDKKAIVNFKIYDVTDWTTNNYSNKIRIHNHLVRKRTLNHFAKLAKWLSCLVSTYLHGAFDCMLKSCDVRVSEWIYTL